MACNQRLTVKSYPLLVEVIQCTLILYNSQPHAACMVNSLLAAQASAPLADVQRDRLCPALLFHAQAKAFRPAHLLQQDAALVCGCYGPLQ